MSSAIIAPSASFNGITTTSVLEGADQAIAAAVLAGAPTFHDTIADGLAATSDGERFIVGDTDTGLTVYKNDGGAAVDPLRMGPIHDWNDLDDLQANISAAGDGTIHTTKTEKFAYVEDATATEFFTIFNGVRLVPVGDVVWAKQFGATADGTYQAVSAELVAAVSWLDAADSWD